MQVENFFVKAAPAMFMGWSNLNFDRRMFHFNFFKGNRYPYLTHSSPNQEHDGLHVARAAQTIDSKTLKTELTEAGNESLKPWRVWPVSKVLILQQLTLPM